MMKTIGQLSAAVYRNMQTLVGNRISDLDLEIGQYDFLYLISKYEGLTQKWLSDRLTIGKSTTAKAVKNLVRKGYVEKRRDEQDGRVEHLFLTEKGRRVAPDIQAIFQKNLEVSARGLSEDELTQLLSLLERVLQNLIAENEAFEKEGAFR